MFFILEARNSDPVPRISVHWCLLFILIINVSMSGIVSKLVNDIKIDRIVNSKKVI